MIGQVPWFASLLLPLASGGRDAPMWLRALPGLILLGGAIGVLLLLRAVARSEPRGFWRQVIRSQADLVEDRLREHWATACHDGPEDSCACGATWRQLELAREAVGERDAVGEPDQGRRPSLFQWLADAWTGASVERGFLSLHAAEISLIPLLSDEEIEVRIPETLHRLSTCAPTDRRRQHAERQLLGRPGRHRRAAFANAVRLGYEIKDIEHHRVRQFRNILFGATGVLTAVVLLLCTVGASFPDAVPLCFTATSTTAPTTSTAAPTTITTGAATTTSATTTTGPTTTTGATTTTQVENTICPSEERPPGPNPANRRLPAPGDVALVALFGLLGGGLSSAFALRKLQGMATTYDVPLALALLKLPSGALTAIVGILLVRGEFIPGLSQLDNQPQILAYAFFFGIAQQVATRYLDSRAETILGRVPRNVADADQSRRPSATPEAPLPRPARWWQLWRR